MKKFVFFCLIICCASCFNNNRNTSVNVSDEEFLFNMTIDSLKGFNIFSNVYGQFNFQVREDVVKRVGEFSDTTLSDGEIDSICEVYYYNCSKSIHDLISERNKELIVYRFPKGNVNIIGYPIMIGEDKAVTINYHYKYLRPHVFQLYPVVLAFEKKDAVWEISNNMILVLDE